MNTSARPMLLMKGNLFAWDNPPPTGNPGDDFGCRCMAVEMPNLSATAYPDAIEPVYPEIFLPMPRFARFIRQLLRAIWNIDENTLTAKQANNLRRFNAKLPKDAKDISAFLERMFLLAIFPDPMRV